MKGKYETELANAQNKLAEMTKDLSSQVSKMDILKRTSAKAVARANEEARAYEQRLQNCQTDQVVLNKNQLTLLRIK